ncbi:MAG: type IV toxin-antitoxin system AbiEi family antitoxin domain-containing protein [Jiangellaceae bacterium]|nr:type IV toxin-antitoxin system AbiEi family antitoxin domain-containing protein [Jiangellaceae bacterium]
MDTKLASIAAGQGGVVLRSQALVHGYTDQEIERLIQQKLWIRIRRGAYINAVLCHAMTPEQRHRAMVHAVVLSLAKPAVVCHSSAAVMLGLPTWAFELSHVHVTRADLHSPRIEGGVHHHAGALADSDVIIVDGVAVTPPDRTAVDMSCMGGFERGVVVADAAIRLQGGDKDLLLHRTNQMRDWRGARNAGRVTEFADGRSESAGESRTRVVFELAGLPRPELQASIVDPRTNGLVARVDYLFVEQATIGEFDGRVKYRAEPEGVLTAEEVLWREKLREDNLRDLGYEVARSVWDDLRQPELIVARYRRCFERAARRRTVLV